MPARAEDHWQWPADYFGIDPDKLEQERQVVSEALASQQEGAEW